MQERPVSAGTGSGSGGRTPAQAAGPDLAAVGVSRVCDHREMAHRYRLYPGATQMAVFEKHCRDARGGLEHSPGAGELVAAVAGEVADVG